MFNSLYRVWIEWVPKHHNREPPERQEPYKPDTDLLLTLQQIDELKVTAERIRQLENILTDIDLIGDNSGKGISLSVPSISGSQTDYTFISSQADTSGFKAAAQSELDRLKRTLQQQIDSLQQQRKRNETNRQQTKGEWTEWKNSAFGVVIIS